MQGKKRGNEYTMSLPPPSLNGGLYTGRPFAADAPHRNFPVAPDAGYMTFHNLRGAAPPPDAICQPPAGGGLRPGNNTPASDLHLQQYDAQHAFACVASGCPDGTSVARRGTARYAYLQ